MVFWVGFGDFFSSLKIPDTRWTICHAPNFLCHLTCHFCLDCGQSNSNPKLSVIICCCKKQLEKPDLNQAQNRSLREIVLILKHTTTSDSRQVTTWTGRWSFKGPSLIKKTPHGLP